MGLFNDIVEMVSPYLNAIKEAFRAFMEKVKGIVKTIIAKIVEFKNQIVAWFKDHPLIKGRHIPFLTQRQEFKDLLKNAPKVKVEGLFEGIYDEQTDEIIDLQYIEADECDQETKEILAQGDEEQLVVLC